MSFLKLAARIGLALILICVVAAIAGATYNSLSIRHYRRVAGIPGKLYNIDGHALHMYCTGEGSPTILLSSGLGDDFTSWAKIQPELSKQTRVCSYDRAGFGWSDSRSEAQDSNAIVSQLHQLVEAAAIQRPFLLVGHSISGIHMRLYAARYPNDLAGIVFVDGSTPLQNDRFPKDLLKMEDDGRRLMPLQKLRMTIGGDRLHGDCAINPGLEAWSTWVKADTCIPSQIDATANELDAVHASGEETVHLGPFGNLPILILSHDPGVIDPDYPAPLAKEVNVIWNQMQEESKSLSTQSRRIIAKGSGHYIHIDRADLVNRELSSFITMLRSHEPFPQNQTTTTQ